MFLPYEVQDISMRWHLGLFELLGSWIFDSAVLEELFLLQFVRILGSIFSSSFGSLHQFRNLNFLLIFLWDWRFFDKEVVWPKIAGLLVWWTLPVWIEGHELLLLGEIYGATKLLHLLRLFLRFILSITMYGVKVIFILDNHFVVKRHHRLVSQRHDSLLGGANLWSGWSIFIVCALHISGNLAVTHHII